MDNLKIERIVHLDLKGAPPKLKFFEEFFPFIKSAGATGILLEWEDTFPYTKELTDIGSLNTSFEGHYSLEEATKILELANESSLNVIPLVQTFGHMEFILKHDQWRNLREVEDYPSSMCPSQNETLPLIRSLINQIVSFHPHLQYIHIGGDEVWHMGLCSTCKGKIQVNKHGKSSLYLEHIVEVAHYIKHVFPDIKIIVWDDMFRKISDNILEEYGLGSLIEPMVWYYDTNESFFNDQKLWDKYTSIFPNIWAASAFKGSTGSCQIIPVLKYHAKNQEVWVRGLENHLEKMRHFKGIVLTGWSRYDHYATLCELLPCGIPSLCLCLRICLEGKYYPEMHQLTEKFLGYKNSFPNLELQTFQKDHETYSFPGWQVFMYMEWLVQFRNKYRNAVNGDQFQSWLNSWQISNNYTNPMQLDSITPVIKNLLVELSSLEFKLKESLGQVFYMHTINEVMGTLVIPMKEYLQKLEYDCLLQRSKGCLIKPQLKLNVL